MKTETNKENNNEKNETMKMYVQEKKKQNKISV